MTPVFARGCHSCDVLRYFQWNEDCPRRYFVNWPLKHTSPLALSPCEGESWREDAVVSFSLRRLMVFRLRLAWGEPLSMVLSPLSRGARKAKSPAHFSTVGSSSSYLIPREIAENLSDHWKIARVFTKDNVARWEAAGADEPSDRSLLRNLDCQHFSGLSVGDMAVSR